MKVQYVPVYLSKFICRNVIVTIFSNVSSPSYNVHCRNCNYLGLVGNLIPLRVHRFI